jgi:hypothetical protein
MTVPKPKSFDKIDWSNDESWMRYFEYPIPITIQDAYPKVLDKIAKAKEKLSKLDVQHRPGCIGFMQPDKLKVPHWAKMPIPKYKAWVKSLQERGLEEPFKYYPYHCSCGAEARQKQVAGILAILELDDEYDLSEPIHQTEAVEITVECSLCGESHV